MPPGTCQRRYGSRNHVRELSPKTPIIALTAYAYEHDKQAAIDAGCNDFLTKPYTQEVLKEMIKKYLK